MLYVIRKNTKSSLEGFNWDAIIEEIQEKAPARFHSTASVPIVQLNMEAKYPKFVWHMTCR